MSGNLVAMPPAPTEVTPAEWARQLGVSRHAIDLYLSSDVIDLHIDSFIWARRFGYRLDRRHGPGLLQGRYFRQVDIPRIREAQVSGATWVITTNPWRTRQGRARAFLENLRRITAIFEAQSGNVHLVRTHSDYLAARQAKKHAVFLGIQGGNAIEDRTVWSSLADGRILRVTLVHLTNSALGLTSSPLRLGRDRGLSRAGRELVEYLDAERILVDLAHASKQTFRDAIETHQKGLPVLVSHTGIDGVYRHWRNLTDEQLKSIADTGGIVGVFYHGPFLTKGLTRGRVATVAKHIGYAVRCVGAEHVALGSDWDGSIWTPKDMPTCLELPRLVQALLDEGLTDGEIQMVLGASFLRMLRELRP